MSIASRIQEMETHIGDVYNIVDYSYDTTGVNKNIINIPKYLKKGYIDIINNGIDQLYSNFPKVSGIGSNLSLTPTYEAPMRNLPLGNTYQQTYTGKNLLPYPYENTGTTVNGIIFTPQSDGSVLVNGTATAQATFPLYGTSATTNQKELTGNYLYGGTNDVRLRAYNHSGSGYTNLGTDTGNGVQINKTTYTTGYIELVVPSGTTINNVVIKPMMLMNLDDTTYEPYVGGVPSPNPDYPQAIQSTTGLQNIEICGKNLFDKNDIKKINAYFDSEGGSITSSDYNRVFYIPCNSNTTYTITQGISTLSNHVLQIATTTEIPNINVIVSNYINYTSLTPQTYTTNATAKYLVFRIRSGDDVSSFWDGVQIELGSTATEYESYAGNAYKVNLGKNLFDKNNITTGKRLYYWQGTATLIDDANYCVSDYIKIKPNATYTINLTMSAYTRMIFFDNNKNPLSVNETNATFTTPNNTAYVRLSVPVNQLDTTQLEKGSTATSYSPYFTPIELNKIGDYQDSIKKSTGKNILNSEIEAGEYNINTGEKRGGAGAYRTATPVEIEPNTTYKFSINGSNYAINVLEYDKDMNFIGYLTSTVIPKDNSFKTSSNTKYINIFRGTTGGNENWQIEPGDTATSYEPYGKVWYLEKQIDKAVYTSSDIANAPRTYSNVKFFTIAKPTNSYMYNNYNRGNLLYTHAVEQITGDLDSADRINKISNVWPETLWIGFETSTTLETAQQVLNNSVLYYPLASTQYITITNTELIEDLESLYTAKSQEGTTNISITSEDLPMLLSASALKGDA